MSELKPCPVCGAVPQQIGTTTMYGETPIFPPAIWATSGTKRVKYVQERRFKKFYAVKTWSDLDDWGETTIERKLYRTREDAEHRAEEVEAWSSDEMYYNAMVVEFEVVE